MPGKNQKSDINTQTKTNVGKQTSIQLPDELFLLIFSHLDPKTLARLSLVNQQFKRVSEDDALWKLHYHNLLGLPITPTRPTKESFKSKYVTVRIKQSVWIIPHLKQTTRSNASKADRLTWKAARTQTRTANSALLEVKHKTNKAKAKQAEKILKALGNCEFQIHDEEEQAAKQLTATHSIMLEVTLKPSAINAIKFIHSGKNHKAIPEYGSICPIEEILQIKSKGYPATSRHFSRQYTTTEDILLNHAFKNVIAYVVGNPIEYASSTETPSIGSLWKRSIPKIYKQLDFLDSYPKQTNSQPSLANVFLTEPAARRYAKSMETCTTEKNGSTKIFKFKSPVIFTAVVSLFEGTMHHKNSFSLPLGNIDSILSATLFGTMNGQTHQYVCTKDIAQPPLAEQRGLISKMTNKATAKIPSALSARLFGSQAEHKQSTNHDSKTLSSLPKGKPWVGIYTGKTASAIPVEKERKHNNGNYSRYNKAVTSTSQYSHHY